MSLDGHNFFYVNPLEVDPEASKKDARKHHVLPVRPKWFGCACCPPNLARLTTSLAKYMYTLGEDEIYVNLYMQNQARLKLGDARVSMECLTDYPASGEIALHPGAGRVHAVPAHTGLGEGVRADAQRRGAGPKARAGLCAHQPRFQRRRRDKAEPADAMRGACMPTPACAPIWARSR